MSFFPNHRFVRYLMTTVMLTLGIIAVAAILFVYLGSTWFITPIRR